MGNRAPGELSLTTLRGGLNVTDPTHAVLDNECVVAENVEFFYSTLGERRAGSEKVDLTNSTLRTQFTVVSLSQWYPNGLVTQPEWWAISTTPSTSVSVASNFLTAWTAQTPNDAIDSGAPDIYYIDSQPLGSLLFWAYHSSQDRLHVWDGAQWRRTGLAEPAAPTGANTGSGSYATTRYFRVRYVELSVAGVVLRRSEPSDTLTFSPSGSGSGVVITKPASISEGETHWEIEASTDNARFYRITRQAVGSTTYTDSTAFATGYSGLGPLSEQIGTYLLQPSAKFLSVDDDRLLLAGHWTDQSRQSMLWWTPRSSDPGAGSSERLPLQINNSVNLDGGEGGPITGLSSAIYGTWYAFKWSHIYAGARTGDVQHAYNVVTVSKSQGAIPGTIIEGSDESGNPCVYFLDPTIGPCRIGSRGLQSIYGVRDIWQRVNLMADIVGHGVYYPYKQQIHWWIAVDGATTPNFKLVLQVSSAVSQGNIVRGGWSTATGRIAEAYTSEILSEQIFNNGTLALSNRPYIGLSAPQYMLRCDVGSSDDDIPYVATIRTKPFIMSLSQKWGTRIGSLLATAATGIEVVTRIVRDFGVEVSASFRSLLTPAGSETMVIRHIDDLKMHDAVAIQIEFSDQ